ncbi:MBL fold metallo-hydrolase [Rarobacter faecitabidus]|nr:MBL fold metallo-hydrolase [Rarobacter faecitabidus]
MSDARYPTHLCLQAPVFATNSIIVETGGSAVIVDAGAGVAAAVLQQIEKTGWTPIAILITHGHVDHTWDAAHLSVALGIPVLVSDADRYQFDDPFGLDPAHPERRDDHGMLVRAFGQHGLHPGDFQVPETLHTLGSDEGREALVRIAGLWEGGFRAIPAPGHTPGATLYEFSGAAMSPLVCTGDVLFRSSIGRTDLPGGDHIVMQATLTRLAAEIPGDALIIPGHGPATTMARELGVNPYLRGISGV